ncbi:hypothetical protein V5735_23690 (plasmid) [Haladaptatus sp. SPP-AMP-3]|uniref:hypothetical protein n=1 Tax=Haladaptatus sp. SPP-AMP-3 TaxID=3121295 RepID=UPI003C300648
MTSNIIQQTKKRSPNFVIDNGIKRRMDQMGALEYLLAEKEGAVTPPERDEHPRNRFDYRTLVSEFFFLETELVVEIFRLIIFSVVLSKLFSISCSLQYLSARPFGFDQFNG